MRYNIYRQKSGRHGQLAEEWGSISGSIRATLNPNSPLRQQYPNFLEVIYLKPSWSFKARYKTAIREMEFTLNPCHPFKLIGLKKFGEGWLSFAVWKSEESSCSILVFRSNSFPSTVKEIFPHQNPLLKLVVLKCNWIKIELIDLYCYSKKKKYDHWLNRKLFNGIFVISIRLIHEWMAPRNLNIWIPRSLVFLKGHLTCK